MLIDANDIEKCSDQAVHVAKLNHATLRLPGGDPVEDAACRRKVDPYQASAGNCDAIARVACAIQTGQRLRSISKDLSPEFRS